MSPTKPRQEDNIPTSIANKQTICEELKQACSGDVGDMVAAHQKMILEYYNDVLNQAKESFHSAKSAAIGGFIILSFTLAYIFMADASSRFFKTPRFESSITVAQVGLISGGLIEFIAGVNFWLYARASKQFSAFHICLERTHRYLIAYKISEKIENQRDETLEKLVCIMANAPMITRSDIDTIDYQRINVKSTEAQVIGSTVDQ